MDNYILKNLEYRVWEDREWHWEDAIPSIRFATEEETKRILKDRVESLVKEGLLTPFKAKYWKNWRGALCSEASREGYLFDEKLKTEYEVVLRDITMAHDFSESD